MAFFIHRLLPKTFTELSAFIFLVSSIHAVAIFELFEVLPSIYASHSESGSFSQNESTSSTASRSKLVRNFHIVVGFFLYINAILNLVRLLKTNTTIRGMILPSILKQGWRFCVVCESNAPPRSYHCSTCNICILKRDHHCMFTGSCVGLFNQRYYMGLLSSMWAAAAYSCLLNIDYLYHLYGTISIKTVLTITFPMISWLFVQSEEMSPFQVFMTSLCLVGLCLTSGLLAYHIGNVLSGQSTYEKTYRIDCYNLGWKENVALVLGTRWKIAWMCPLIASPIPSDGLAFVTKQEYESLKSM